jgi:hypothetical protein
MLYKVTLGKIIIRLIILLCLTSDFSKQRTPTSIFALANNPIMESVIHIAILQNTGQYLWVTSQETAIDLVSQKQTKCLAELELSTWFKEVRLLNKLMMIRIITVIVIIIIIIIIILATAFTVSLHMPESSNDTKCSTFSYRKLIIL